jgi:intracellular sulfur oxidation DsrE/DsrF family protein
MKAIIIIQAIVFFIAVHFLVDEEKSHDKTKAQLNSYKVKLFECAHALNRREGER